MSILRALWRGARLRCPHCGLGRVFARYLRMDDGCLECSHVYIRDRGDWTGSAEATIILSVATSITAALLTFMLLPNLNPALLLPVALGVLAAVIPPIFRRVKGIWVGVLYLWSGWCREPELTPDAKKKLVRLRGAR